MSYHKITIHMEVPVTVHFEHQPQERMTRHYPGCDPSVDVTEIEIDTKEILKKYEVILEQECWDHLRYLEAEREVCEAEYRHDWMTDR